MSESAENAPSSVPNARYGQPSARAERPAADFEKRLEEIVGTIADLPASTTETTWGRIVDPHSPVKGWGAFSPSGDLLGFAHTVLHPHTWSPKQLCYLEDLFVAIERRSSRSQ